MAITTTTQGIAAGVCLSTARPTNPYLGQVIFETDTGKMKAWLGSSWSNGYTHTSSFSVEYLIIAGGGGGGTNIGGGGGAGGYRTNVPTQTSGRGSAAEATLNLVPATYTVVVGAGGATRSNGLNSSFAAIESIGGGRGGGYAVESSTSGGAGGGSAPNSSGSSGTTAQGYDGGSNSGSGSGNWRAGGGGGAGAAGSGGTGAGHGGSGLSNNITGTSVTRAGGGGAGGFDGGAAGAGGSGGGGGGGATGSYGGNGAANTGSGGGGTGNYPGDYAGVGGSGVVIISYANSLSLASATTGSPIYSASRTGYHTYIFNSSGSITF